VKDKALRAWLKARVSEHREALRLFAKELLYWHFIYGEDREVSGEMTKEELLKWLWVIFIIEGDCKASVPFGWIKQQKAWRRKRISFRGVMAEVAKEVKLEWKRFLAAKEKGYEGDFIRWMARVGYNANPKEMADWERNARSVFTWLEKLLSE